MCITCKMHSIRTGAAAVALCSNIFFNIFEDRYAFRRLEIPIAVQFRCRERNA